MRISVVIPVFNERGNVEPLAADVRAAIRAFDWELIFVNDGSTDGTAQVLDELSGSDRRVKVVHLQRNSGQSAATQAGFDAATGDVIVTLDGDRQNDPADIPRLVAKLAEGYDAVLGLRVRRQDQFLLRRLPSLCGNWLLRKSLGIPFRDFGCSIRAMRCELVNDLSLYGERHRYLTALILQRGARVTQIPVRHHPRTSGSSKYGLGRTLRVLLDLMTFRFVVRYQARPMHFFGTLGLFLLFAGIAGLIASALCHDSAGLWMLMAAMTVLLGAQSLGLGLLGESLAQFTFSGSAHSIYSIRQTRNLEIPHRDTSSHFKKRHRPAHSNSLDLK